MGRAYVSLEIEVIISDRPLPYVSSDIKDEEPLTPSHLLHGRRILHTPYPQDEMDTSDIPCRREDISKRAQQQARLIKKIGLAGKQKT